MGKSIPCQGYPSKKAAAIALKAKGLGLAEIARRINARTGNVSNMLSHKPRKSSADPNIVRVKFTPEQMAVLANNAEAEGWSVEQEIMTRCFHDWSGK